MEQPIDETEPDAQRPPLSDELGEQAPSFVRAPFYMPLTPRECVELDIESGRTEYDWFNRP